MEPPLIAWIALAAAGLIGSALWSGLETGVYCMSRVRLRIRSSDPRDRAARTMAAEIENPERALTTILIGNNVCNYLGTLGLTAVLEAADLDPFTQVVLQVIVLSPVLLVFGEALPKNLMRLEADLWPYRLVSLLRAARWLFTALLILPMVRAASALLRRALRMPDADRVVMGRERVAELLRETVPTGALSAEQASLVDRALRFESATVRDEMVPWTLVDAVRLHWSAARIRQACLRSEHTRMPVIDAAGHVAGVLNQVRFLIEPDRPLPELLEQPSVLDAGESVRGALRRLRESGVPMAVVADDRGRPIGLVTAKDLVEPLTGELRAW